MLRQLSAASDTRRHIGCVSSQTKYQREYVQYKSGRVIYLDKCDESNALESACVWESHEVNILNLPTIAPVLSHILFLQKLTIDQQPRQFWYIITHNIDESLPMTLVTNGQSTCG